MISLGSSDANEISILCTYLLSGEWEGWMGRYLAWGLCVLTESQIFSRPARPNSANMNFIIWPLCLNFCNRANPHQSVCFSSSAISGTFFGYGFPTKLHTGPFGSHDKNLCAFFFITTVWTIWLLFLCHDRGLSFSCFIIVVVVVVFFSSFLVVHCCGMTLFCLSVFHSTGTTKKSEVSKAATRHKDSNKQIRQ